MLVVALLGVQVVDGDQTADFLRLRKPELPKKDNECKHRA